MALKINVNLPEDVVVGDHWIIEWDAVDPVTGASIAGVKVSSANVTASDEASAAASSDGSGFVGPFLAVPGPDG